MQTQVNSPYGIITVNHPAGATEEEILAYAKSQVSQPQEMSPEERNQIGREELGNPLQAGLIGAGRFTQELGQGIKQKGLMAGEALGLVDEGRADEYTRGINEERQRWEQLTKGGGAEDVGYYAAMMAPGALLPGAGVAGTVGMAAAETGLMPTQEASWEETGKQAAIGGATAGVIRALPNLYRMNKARTQKKQLDKMDPDAVALSERGVKMSPDVYAPSVAKTVSREIVDVPIVSPILRGRPMRKDAERVMREMVDENTSSGGIQDAFNEGMTRIKGKEKVSWDEFWNTPDYPGKNPIILGNVPVEETRIAQRLFDAAKNEAELDYLKTIDKLIPLDQNNGLTLKGLHQWRSNVADTKNWDSTGVSAGFRDRVYQAFTEELENTTEKVAGKRGLETFRNRIAESGDTFRTKANTRMSAKTMLGKIDSEKTFTNIALGNDPDKMTALKTIIGTEGAPAVRSRIANDILDTYLEQGPEQGAKLINKLDQSIDFFFGPDDAAMYRGLGKFLKNIPEGPKDFSSWMTTGAFQGIVGGATGGPGTGLAIQGALSVALRRRDVQAMLQKLSKTPKDSKLANELTKYIGLAIAGDTAKGDPMEIEIRNGRQ